MQESMKTKILLFSFLLATASSQTIANISIHEAPQQSPGFLLWHTSTSWRRVIEQSLQEYNLTHPQFVVLATLAWLTQKGNRVTQAETGHTAGLDPNTTSQILRGLEAKKYIERVRPDDKSKNPILTPLGSKILKIALPAVEKADANFFVSLQSQELETLVSLFQKLVPQKMKIK